MPRTKHIGTTGHFEIKLSDLRKIIKSIDEEEHLPRNINVSWCFKNRIGFAMINYRKDSWKPTPKTEAKEK